MKKNYFCLIISLILCSSVFALDSNYLSFKITPRFGVVNGAINEFVFDEVCTNTDNKVSQLDWDIRNIPVFGLKAEFDILRYININVDGSFGIPKKSGYMQDYDWLNSFGGIDPDIPVSWSYDEPTELTCYSKHTNELKRYTDFLISVGGNIFLPYNLRITPFITYQYEFIYLAGQKGFGRYKQADKTFYLKDYSDNNKVISYQQEINAMFLGFSILFDNIPRTTLYADFKVSPKMTFLNALDFHYTRNIVFWDKIDNLWQLKGTIEAQYKFDNHYRAGIITSIQYIPIGKGDTSKKYLNSDGTIKTEKWYQIGKNSGGTSRFIWSLGINYSFSL